MMSLNSTSGKVLRCTCGNVLGVQTEYTLTIRKNGREIKTNAPTYIVCEKCGKETVVQNIKAPNNEILQETHMRQGKPVYIITSDAGMKTFYRYDIDENGKRSARVGKADSPTKLY